MEHSPNEIGDVLLQLQATIAVPCKRLRVPPLALPAVAVQSAARVRTFQREPFRVLATGFPKRSKRFLGVTGLLLCQPSTFLPSTVSAKPFCCRYGTHHVPHRGMTVPPRKASFDRPIESPCARCWHNVRYTVTYKDRVQRTSKSTCRYPLLASQHNPKILPWRAETTMLSTEMSNISFHAPAVGAPFMERCQSACSRRAHGTTAYNSS